MRYPYYGNPGFHDQKLDLYYVVEICHGGNLMKLKNEVQYLISSSPNLVLQVNKCFLLNHG